MFHHILILLLLLCNVMNIHTTDTYTQYPLQSIKQWRTALRHNNSDTVINNIVDTAKYYDTLTDAVQLNIAQVDLFVQQYIDILNNTKLVLNTKTTEQLIKETTSITTLIHLSTLQQHSVDHTLKTIYKSNTYNKQQKQLRRLVMTNLLSNKQFSLTEYNTLYRAYDQLICFWFSSNMKLFKLYMSQQQYVHNAIQYINMSISNYNIFDENLNSLYYAVSYLDDTQTDIRVKNQLNGVLQSFFTRSEPHQMLQQRYDISVYKPHTGKLKLAVISEFWFKRHSVYRITQNYVTALYKSNKFDMTLINIGDLQYDTDTTIFHHIYNFTDENYLHQSQAIIQHCIEQDYDIVYMPAVGMSWTDIFLANTRLAYFTVATHGHSVSSYGTLIDYWISGDKVESLTTDNTDTVVSQAQFSEQLVLLFGYGAVHTQPNLNELLPYKHIHDNDVITIALPVTPQKIHYKFLILLQNALQQIDGTVDYNITIKLNFFSYIKAVIQRTVLHNNILSVLQAHPYKRITLHVTIMPEYSYIQYIAALQQCDICLESNTYGGGNTIIDCIYAARIPTLTIQHSMQWYGRIGTAIVQQLNNTELNSTLVSYTTEQYIDKIVKFVVDHKLRTNIRNTIETIDMKLLFDNTAESKYFVQTLRLLYRNHKRYKHNTLQRKRQQLLPVVLYAKQELDKLKQQTSQPKTEL